MQVREIYDSWRKQEHGCYKEELDRVEDLRVARELSGDSQGEDPSPKKKELEGKKYLDPVKEHLPWHPLVVREEGGWVARNVGVQVSGYATRIMRAWTGVWWVGVACVGVGIGSGRQG